MNEFKNVKILFNSSQKNKVNSIFKKKTFFMIKCEKKKHFNKIVLTRTRVLSIDLECNKLKNCVI